MSAQDLASALGAGESISVEVGGQHLFDVVQPLNALDEQFLTISRYVGREVAAEFKRKIESMRVEDMFDSRNVQSVLASVASTINARGAEEMAKAAKPAAAPAAEKKTAAAKRKPAAATAEKKPATRARPSRAKAKPAAAAAAREAEVEPQPAARAKTAAPVTPERDLDLEPFPQDASYADQDLNEDLVASEAPLANTVHDGLDSDPYPENDHDAEEFFADTLAPAGKDPYDQLPADDLFDEVPADELFADLKEMELTSEEIAAEDQAGTDEGDDDEDDEFSDGPIVRRIARNRD